MQKLMQLKYLNGKRMKQFSNLLDFVETESGKRPIDKQHLNNYNKPLEQYKVKVIKYDKMTVKRGLTQQPQPVSPVLEAIKVKQPKIGVKKYRWCSCGQSLKQPFCDGNHKGTAFKPMRFIVEQDVQEIELCGCKLTKNAPFCDKETCCALKQQSK